jgi:hypothetical protein
MANSPQPIPTLIPKGTVLPWFSKEVKAPKGWQFCDGKDGRPDLNGIWLVGTNDAASVGALVNRDSINLPFSTGPTADGNKYSWGDTENNTPHATGLDHTHRGTVTLDPAQLGPPSIKVRFIIKID